MLAYTYNQIEAQLENIENLNNSYVQSDNVKRVKALRVEIVKNWLQVQKHFIACNPDSKIAAIMQAKHDIIKDRLAELERM